MVRLLVAQAYADTFDEALGASPGKRLLKAVEEQGDPVLFFPPHDGRAMRGSLTNVRVRAGGGGHATVQGDSMNA
ncbi:hypothetical protein KDX04_03245 [Burkholderia cenocepacia]|uniref:hypothetical protein n=1 Tax=Burkholderia cenocepacia TaxID=95486 RepID=UPI001B9FA4B2|nr:hypothetical protein [Burkholderia cenocepacia]MBR7984828.1 hypothetical protein [Burkholderia cenocepacia]